MKKVLWGCVLVFGCSIFSGCAQQSVHSESILEKEVATIDGNKDQQPKQAADNNKEQTFLLLWQGKGVIFVDERIFLLHSGDNIATLNVASTKDVFVGEKDLMLSQMDAQNFNQSEKDFASVMETLGWKSEGVEEAMEKATYTCTAELMLNTDSAKIAIGCSSATSQSSTLAFPLGSDASWAIAAGSAMNAAVDMLVEREENTQVSN